MVQSTVFIAWIFFRSADTAQAFGLLRNLFGLGGWTGEPLILWKKGLIMTLPIVFMHLRTLLAERWGVPQPKWIEKSLYAGLMLFAILTCKGMYNKFIYFQF